MLLLILKIAGLVVVSLLIAWVIDRLAPEFVEWLVHGNKQNR